MRAIFDPVIQRNALFGHPENVLLAMLTDERSHVRKLASRRILAARQQRKAKAKAKVRQFSVPNLNFAATDYIDLISWRDTDRYEPPLTKLASDETILKLVNKPTAE